MQARTLAQVSGRECHELSGNGAELVRVRQMRRGMLGGIAQQYQAAAQLMHRQGHGLQQVAVQGEAGEQPRRPGLRVALPGGGLGCSAWQVGLRSILSLSKKIGRR